MSERGDLSSAPIPAAGIQRLLEQTVDSVRGWLAGFDFEEAHGDTPIEKLFFAALVLYVRFGFSYHESIHVVTDDELRQRMKDPSWLTTGSLLVQPQCQLRGWRVDFLIHAYSWGGPTGPEGWRKLIVECDGHDFHERTKEQALRDRSRDREGQLAGATVFRFTGAEIVNDPWGCARQVCDWAEKGS